MKCSIEGCPYKADARGLCNSHYAHCYRRGFLVGEHSRPGRNHGNLTGSLISKYRCDAKKRQLEWSLNNTQTRLLFQQPCWYCNAAPNTVFKRGHTTLIYNGIDRIDNTQGYTADNTVTCCAACNKSKMTGTAQDYIRRCRQVAEKHAEFTISETGRQS